MIEHPIGIAPASGSEREALSAEHRAELGRPFDDMWRTFAEQAPAFVLSGPPGGEAVGYYSLDEEAQLREFYLRPNWRSRAEGTFAQVLEQGKVQAALPTAFDELFASLSSERATSSGVVAQLYELGADPEAPRTQIESLRIAESADFESAVAFEVPATGAPLSFLEFYVGARIAAGELLLHEVEGVIQAVGELRADPHFADYLHLGVIVGEAQRRQGLATSIMSYLVAQAKGLEKTPICSTDPENKGAQRAIERAGFRVTSTVTRTSFV